MEEKKKTTSDLFISRKNIRKQVWQTKEKNISSELALRMRDG